MQAQDRHVLVTVATVVTSIILFAVPLILRYRVYKPVSVHVATSDSIPLRRGISTTWCESQLINANVSFNAYLFPEKPVIVRHDRKEYRTTQRIRIANGVREYWGFYLLEGSSVSVSLCARSPGAVLSVVKGHHSLHQCLQDYLNYAESGRKESDESSDESDLETGPISSSLSSSQGVMSNETLQESLICKRAILHAPLKWDYRCSAKFRAVDTKTTISFDINHSDHYYFLFASETYLDLLANDIEAEFHFKRSRFSYSDSVGNCTNVTSCELPLSLFSRDNVVAEVLYNSTWTADTLVTECVPRRGLYFLFFVALAVVILICAFQ